jgi:GcrA cell cycle regulator
MPVNAPDDDLAIPAKQRRTLMQLKAQQCHWPVGDPSATGFFFCGAVVEPGYLYCPAHCARAYRTPSQFREERKQVQRKAA